MNEVHHFLERRPEKLHSAVDRFLIEGDPTAAEVTRGLPVLRVDKQGRSHYRDQRCGNCGAVFGTSLLELEIAPVVEDAEAIVALSRTGGKQSYAKRAGKA